MKRITAILVVFALLTFSLTALAELRKGSSGTDVVELQKRLIELGYLDDAADGVFGKNTEKALKGFQENNGLEVTGIATIKDINVLFSDDAKPAAVQASGGEDVAGPSGGEAQAEIQIKETLPDTNLLYHLAEYEQYNSYASENGLNGDYLLLYGEGSTLRNTVSTKCLVLEQSDGKRWVIVCGDYTIDTSAFTALLDHPIIVFCTYMGFSDEYKMPSAEIIDNGGIYDIESDQMLCTDTAEILMDAEGISPDVLRSYAKQILE